MPKRAILWVFVLAVVILAVARLRGEAAAQVFQGLLKFNDQAFIFTRTVTL